MCVDMRIGICMDMCMHARTHARSHAHTHARTHARTHACTHAYFTRARAQPTGITGYAIDDDCYNELLMPTEAMAFV